ncbi:MAG: FAD-dependent oxidoreductase [Rhodocyclaceae bacterium]|nr:FAD-dependent oxidoreductase [Rhodocyclaceae bacterium]
MSSVSVRTGLADEAELTRRSYYLASSPEQTVSAPLSGVETADVCVVGGGLAGLSAALELRARGFSVAVLEGMQIGWGASGRNGGQVIVGHANDEPYVDQLGLSDAKRAWDISVEGTDLVRQRIKDYAIDCDYVPGWLYLAVNKRKSAALREGFDFTRDKFAYSDQTWIAPQDIGQWISSPRFHAGYHDARSGHLHPLKYTRGIAKAALAAGAKIFEHSRATAITRGANPVVRTASGEVRCRFIVLAGNCYLGKLVPEIDARIMPVGTYVVASNPLSPELAASLTKGRAAVCDSNFILDYFRPSNDNRLIFGGRVSYSTMTPIDLDSSMRARMLKVFPQLGESVKVDYSWGGFVDITMNRSPDFGRVADNIYYLQGFSGHGLALTGIAGKLVAETIAGQAERFDIYARLKHFPFPGGKLLRTPALVLGMLWYQLRDMV